MRLIDADALIKQIDTEREFLAMNGNLGAEHILVHYVRNFIEDAPTIDAVEVVRCKDCEHYNGMTHGCKRNPCVEPWGKNDFCSYGEKSRCGLT